MPRNARTHDARLILRRAALLIILLSAISAPVTAGELAAERKEYLAEQKRKTQEAREVNDNLFAELTPLTAKEEDAFVSAMRNGTRESDPSFEILKAGLKLEFFKVTDPKVRSSQEGLRILKNHLQNRILGGAGVAIRGPGAKENFRRLVCQESVKILRQLLKNNLDARALAIILLPSLQPVDPPNLNDPKRQILDESAITLAEILKDPEQPDSVKLIAAYSAGLYLDRVDPGGNIEMKLAEALTGELESWLPADGYQLQLLETLSKIRTPREISGLQRRAITFEALANVLQDKRRDHLIRCRAAGAMGTVGFDAAIKFDPLAWKIVQVAAELGSQHNAQPGYPHWRKCGEQLFLAFHQKEGAAGTTSDGLLNRAPRSELVQAAYGKVLPLCAGLILNQNMQPDAIEDAADWAEENAPEGLLFDTNSPPLNP